MNKKFIAFGIAVCALSGCATVTQKQTHGDYETKMVGGLIGAATEVILTHQTA